MTEIKTDIAIVAGGPAGLAAAISAAESGASVALFEKAATTGGSANMGMGLFAVESGIQKKMMINLTREEAYGRYMEAMDWNVDAKIVHDYFWRSADTIDWLSDMGVQFVGAIKNFPDSEQTWHVVMPEGGGQPGSRCAAVMFKRMHERATELGVDFHLCTPVMGLSVKDGAVTGLTAKSEFGEEYEVSAQAVIIATGGFGTNPKMIDEECGYTVGKDMFTFMIPGIVGDGVRMAWDAGAARGRMMMEKIIGHALPTVLTGEINQFLNFMQGSPIGVNKAGKRVCDESIMQNMSLGANIIDRQAERTFYKVLDDKMIRHFRKKGQEFPNEVFPGDPTEDFDEVWARQEEQYPDIAFTADSIEELGEKMGIDAQALSETIERYNDLCDEGHDEDFGKPRQFLRPINGKKLYAYRMSISAYGSLGGIKINSDYQAIAEDGSVVKGLYAAGNDSCEIYNGTYYYYFPGNSMGYAINSGRFAGENAVAQTLGEL